MDMRSLRTSFQTLDTTSCGGTGLGKDVEKKMEVMKTCVEKVETAVYGMIIQEERDQRVGFRILLMTEHQWRAIERKK